MCDIIKARTNQAGKSVFLVYDKVRGIDSERTSIAFCKEMGLVSGNKNSMYFSDDKANKFSLVDIHGSFDKNRDLYKIMYGQMIPILENSLSALTPEELTFNDDIMSY